MKTTDGEGGVVETGVVTVVETWINEETDVSDEVIVVESVEL